MQQSFPKMIAALLGMAACLAAAGQSVPPAATVAGSPRISVEEHKAIEAAMRRFDLHLAPSEQASIRDLDTRLAALPAEERGRYVSVLRKFHNWLAALPDTVRQKVLDTPPTERMAVVKNLLARYPVPNDETPTWIRLSEVGGGSSIELAVIAKIWIELSPEQKKEVESSPLVMGKRERLIRLGKASKLFREMRPPDFHPDEWLSKVESRREELRLVEGDLLAPINRADAKAETGKTKADLRPRLRPAVLERLELNLYFLSHPPAPVAADRLDAFLHSLPAWVQSSFDPYPADEARRKLTEVYRLVYPPPQEFHPGTSKSSKVGAASGKSESRPPQAAPGREPSKTAPPVSPPTSPF